MQAQSSSMPTVLKAGAIAGLGGGLVFGLMIGMMGMLPMVGMLVGQQNAIVGFVVHMIISAFIGATFGAIAARLPAGWTPAVIGGAIYGIAWWILGALILMPLLLGMSQMVLVIGGPQWMSLIGHIIYGLITGALFVPLNQRL
jgi:uncharacterized membrane protein YagU involved in acid resistance